MGPSSQAVVGILVGRALRDFGDGFVAIILPVYLSTLGMSAFEVGLVATLALLGSALVTLAMGWLGARHDHRRLLLAAALLMVATGLAYAAAGPLWVLFLVAFVGTINPAGGSTSPFVPIEHAVLAGAVPPERRTRVFARYSLAGALAGALGSLFAAAPEWIEQAGFERADALRLLFVVYAALGATGGLAYCRVPASRERAARSPSPLGPSRAIVLRLAALFSLDAFAGGLAAQSLLALWLFERFGLSLAAAGQFFFASSLLAAVSFPLAAWIGARAGLVNTMVFTHIPSSLCPIAAAFAGSVEAALALLLVRAFLAQMDVPVRSSYVMALVTPPERPAAASITAVPRSLAAAASPALAGALISAGLLAWPLALCGALKIALRSDAFRRVSRPEDAGGNRTDERLARRRPAPLLCPLHRDRGGKSSWRHTSSRKWT
ncbi:MAG: MFS transporter [Burkholderiales bacterium]|nr:MFS transporter [Burkholderiales bacterium]